MLQSFPAMRRRSRFSVLAGWVASAAASLAVACGGRTLVFSPDGGDVRGDNDAGKTPFDASVVGVVDAGMPDAAIEVGGMDATAAMDGQSDGNVTSCAQYNYVTVGSYVIETNYWNQGACPGTQCMTVDQGSGAFSVTKGPNCGNTVATYPNALYGSSFGASSPGSVLPKQVETLTSVTSSWSFSVGGVPTDRYDVAYDIWFCPNDACGSAGFNGGAELMIWLDYQNTAGWMVDLGSVSLGGHNWEVWTFTQGQGTANTWTYMAYLIQPPMVTSVTNFNLLSFFQDAMSRGYVQKSWYLYAVQAGDEIRTGGLPFDVTSFSVSVH